MAAANTLNQVLQLSAKTERERLEFLASTVTKISITINFN